MKNDWANDSKTLAQSASLKQYILHKHKQPDVEAALANENFMVTERSDTIDDLFTRFEFEINRYVTTNDVLRFYPEMNPENEDYTEELRLAQFNLAVFEIMKEVNQLYGTIGRAYPNKNLSELVELDDSALWEKITQQEIEKSKSLQALVKEKYPGKLILGVSREYVPPTIHTKTAELIMREHNREVLELCRGSADYEERVGQAILALVRHMHVYYNEDIIKNPTLTIKQITENSGLARE